MWEVESLSTDELESELTRLEALKAKATAVQVALLGEADRRQLPTWDGCRNLNEWASARLDVGPDTAKRLVGLSKRLKDLPEIYELMSEGEVGAERASALSTIAGATSEFDALERTRGLNLSGVCRLASHHRRMNRREERRNHDSSYFVVQPSLDESWWNLRGGLTGAAGAAVSEAIRQRADQLPADSKSQAHRSALALESVCLDALDQPLPDGTTPRTPAVAAFVNLDDDAGGETGAEIAAGPRIGPDTLEEFICTGSVSIVGLSGQRPVVTTDSARRIPPSVRDYVLWRDGACRAPGCESRYRLQPHHINHRSRRGDHDPDNLVTLCWFHHHVVIHRRGMRLHRQSDGTIRFVHPSASRSPP